MGPALVPTDRIAPEALHAAFGLAFADYVAGPFALPLSQWPAFIARQGIELALGRAALDGDGAVCAFAFVAPRPELGRWRLATMGALPAARGSGAAVRLLEDFVGRGRDAGLAALELEVFAQNERALRLYRRFGFVERHALCGYRIETPEGPAVPPPPGLERTPAQALAWLHEAETAVPDLPLQVGATVVAALATPWTAWQRGGAQLVFSGDREAGLTLRSLIDRDPAQRDAEALVRALSAAWPAAAIAVPALQRAELGGDALRRCGFAPEPLWQWLMRLDLGAPAGGR